MDAATGKPIWKKNVAVTSNNNAPPAPPPKGNGPVWPGTQYGIEDYSAVDQNSTSNNNNPTLYAGVSNMGFNFFLTNKTSHEDYVSPMIDQIKNGVGNGTITAIDVKTGKIKWCIQHHFRPGYRLL